MHNKKVISLICMIVATFVFSGCASGHASESAVNSVKNQKIARIEVFSAADNNLLKTIDDKSILDKFAEKTTFFDSEYNYETSDDTVLAKYKPNYKFVVYKVSSVVGSTDLEKIYDLTTYTNTNIIKLQLSPDVVKNMEIPSDLLTYNFKISVDVVEYLNSLI